MQKASIEKGPVFIVGNSRSGTTMLMRAFNLHSKIHAVNEPHFWERLYLPDQPSQNFSEDDAVKLMSRLICSQRQAFQQEEDVDQYRKEASKILSTESKTTRSEMDVYRQFLYHETQRNGKEVVCEKTPRNAFYLEHILRAFPNALVINMVRDPRSVLLSQKMKWKRKKLGSTGQPGKERWRLRLNYHPWIMSKLWVSGIKAAVEFEGDSRVMSIRFEDFLENPRQLLSDVCQKLNLPFEAHMMEIPFAGSSTEMDDTSKTGIRSKKHDEWVGGLSNAEIVISDSITRKWRSHFHYQDSDKSANPILIAAWYAMIPVKLGLALFFNLSRYRNIWAFVKKRF